ncbi:hypothetical protein K437DRAFT_271016 [Tilletiaria anomala UBC 951]|uniref:Disintegrin and metalloproteinase domain-containing protein B n=1 Tax=Tilletiaria anomala (strain ATCC 24038 / CBS 436.72 / UBC 951) TaxID=1037660 RepID=A0A066V617_TILAU|nr:uncharacterized protein K437DRAFT_271016 [Tilletiaria anomala UBC 951]KDN36881.1 hypothetical protein K437DRAFT_271016 [Tilletiaria anomala UBC 951]
MRVTLSRTLAAALLSIVLLPFHHVLASSTLSSPLQQIDLADSISIEPLNPTAPPVERRYEAFGGLSRRTIRHSDSFVLTLRAFNQTFKLHLEPNDELVHPDGITVRYSGERTEWLSREEVRAYRGVVLHPAFSNRRRAEDEAGLWRRSGEGSGQDVGRDFADGIMGHASILLHDDGTLNGRQPSFEGMFSWTGNMHTIQTKDRYEASRQASDPRLEKRGLDGHVSTGLVVHRRSDRMSESEMRARGLAPVEERAGEGTLSTGCNSDKLAHNLKFQNGDILHGETFFETPSGLSVGMRRRSLGERFPGFGSLLALSEAPSADMQSGTTLHHGLPTSRELSFDYNAWQHILQRRQATGSDTAGPGSNSSYISTIGSRQGCPNAARVVYIGAAADCTYSTRFSNESDVRTAMLENLNTVSNLYRQTYNVSIGVVELNVQSAACPTSPSSSAMWNRDCSSSYSLDNRLSDFSAWRGSRSTNGTGLWHLMTACGSGQAGGEIGIAWLGTLCMTQASQEEQQTVSGTGVSSLTNSMWEVIAHEIGHNFGAIHDCSSGCSLRGSLAVQSYGATCCPSSSSACYGSTDYVMNPVSSPSAQTFSACTIGNVCSLLGGGLGSDCIVAPGERATLSAQQCGNGILEPGEECDAGPRGSQCCSTTCKLTSGSRCDPLASACCTDSCQYAPSTKVCRPSIDDRCDSAEMCSGTSAECPADVTKPDGKECGSDGLMCASGHCTSRDQQCQQQGTSLNLTQACPVSTSGTCSIACLDPRGGNSCLVLQQTFIDGTSCGYGGRCRSGECVRGDWQSTFRSWYTNNLRISIPVTIGAAILVLLILACIVRACRRRGGSYADSRAVPSTAWRSRDAQQHQNQRHSRSSSAHANDALRQSRQYHAPNMPPPPPPSAAPTSYGQVQRQRQAYSGSGYENYGYDHIPNPNAPPPVPPRHGQAVPSPWVDTSQYNGY